MALTLTASWQLVEDEITTEYRWKTRHYYSGGAEVWERVRQIRLRHTMTWEARAEAGGTLPDEPPNPGGLASPWKNTGYRFSPSYGRPTGLPVTTTWTHTGSWEDE